MTRAPVVRQAERRKGQQARPDGDPPYMRRISTDRRQSYRDDRLPPSDSLEWSDLRRQPAEGDLVARLRKQNASNFHPDPQVRLLGEMLSTLCHDAADEIERLRGLQGPSEEEVTLARGVVEFVTYSPVPVDALPMVQQQCYTLARAILRWEGRK